MLVASRGLVGGGWVSLDAMRNDEEPRGTRLNLRQGLLVLGLFKLMERRQDRDRPGMVPGGLNPTVGASAGNRSVDAPERPLRGSKPEAPAWQIPRLRGRRGGSFRGGSGRARSALVVSRFLLACPGSWLGELLPAVRRGGFRLVASSGGGKGCRYRRSTSNLTRRSLDARSSLPCRPVPTGGCRAASRS